ncbi:hypothetical protein [Spiroplasma endosymbiont of Polydrusus formosus]|uniref:hypothetical protein n=1 Tax=Spiroplasma endosymbiont of Polydrusus formosus TaxID=3139326 RepID=UPI0035B515A5
MAEILKTKTNHLNLKNLNSVLLKIFSEKILAKLSKSKNNQNIILLENIKDPGNLGTLMRTVFVLILLILFYIITILTFLVTKSYELIKAVILKRLFKKSI